MFSVSKAFFLLLSLQSMSKCRAISYPVDEIYSEMNAFRLDPLGYAQSRSINLACTEMSPQTSLDILPELEQESAFQAGTLAMKECEEISHQTCEQYCYLFGGSCSYLDRIQGFVGPYHLCDMREVLIKGAKKPMKIMRLLLESRGHCDHLIRSGLNYMGANITHIDKTLFVMSMVNLC